MGMPKIESTDISKCQSATAVIQSIALTEAALAHILNAEGEKIQKVLCMPACECHFLLEVNQSVQDTVCKVTELENVLKDKLELVIPLLED